jgi:hypothetical protein
MIVKLSGVLPKDDDKNGLTDAQKLLGEGPRKTFLVVALVSGGISKLDYDADETTLTLRIRHAEVVPEDHRPIVAEALFQALQNRTGALMLPYEVGEEFKMEDDDGE